MRTPEGTAGTSYPMVITGRDLDHLARQVNTKFEELEAAIQALKPATKPKPSAKPKKE